MYNIEHMSDESIRASEIAEYVYCRRAWWLRRSGLRNDNVRQLVAGTEHHQAHGGLVRRARRFRLAFYVMLTLAFVALVVTVLQVL